MKQEFLILNENLKEIDGHPEKIDIDNPYSDELKLIKSFPEPMTEEIRSRKVNLGPKEKKYTLLLDLDGTLVFSQFVDGSSTPSGKEIKTDIRPYAHNLLEELSTLYELIVFTAAEEEYALKMVSLLDMEKKYIKGVLSRNYCIPTIGGYYIKDLRIIQDRKIEEMLIADNSICSFAFQLDNGIPICTYEGEKNDEELVYLTKYLKELYQEANIVEVNKINFELKI